MSDDFDTESDRARAMGIVLGIVDSFRESVVRPGTDPNIVRAGLANIAESVAKQEFGEHWDRFVAYVRKHVELTTDTKGASDDEK